MTDKITERVHHHVRRNIKEARSRDLGESTHFRDDLHAFDLDMVQLIMDCEDEWDGEVFLTDEEAERLQTVGELVALVKRKLANPAAEAA